MSGHVLQGPIVSRGGKLGSRVRVEVRNAETGDYAVIYSDREMQSGLPNPFDAEYFYRCYAEAGRYDIYLSQYSDLVQDYRDVEIGIPSNRLGLDVTPPWEQSYQSSDTVAPGDFEYAGQYPLGWEYVVPSSGLSQQKITFGINVVDNPKIYGATTLRIELEAAEGALFAVQIVVDDVAQIHNNPLAGINEYHFSACENYISVRVYVNRPVSGVQLIRVKRISLDDFVGAYYSMFRLDMSQKPNALAPFELGELALYGAGGESLTVGAAFSVSSNAPGYPVSNAFNGDGFPTFWRGASYETGEEFIQVALTSAKKILRYEVTTSTSLDRTAKTLALYGSGDGQAWSLVDQQASLTWENAETKIFYLPLG
ncbi:discoidin domain-containing protein [Teredinibacter turnerae]|uniref:discoidin domain-containing protein n=1 Tax=Teredinibacter turnerae TaxID=2426 RepID=UPI0030CC60C6